MLPTQELIDHLAHRIEQAYALRRFGWYRGCSTRRVWAAAAMCLWQAHVEDPALPLDSELFVASQARSGQLTDPWADLAGVEAARRYRFQVRRIVRRLRRELRREITRAEKRIDEGGRLIGSALAQDGRLSALGCFIAAHRKGRADLAGRFAAAALEQHRACPLYQSASVGLLPPDCYPLGASGPVVPAAATRDFKKSIVLN